jgi:phosphatidylserine decarboxylase
MTQSDNKAQGTGSNLLTLDTAGPVQMGFWVPNRVWATARFLIPLRKAIAGKKKAGTLTEMRPEIKEFKHWVTTHSVYRMWVTSLIEQANAYVLTHWKDIKDIHDDGDAFWIDGYDGFFETLNEIITTSPSFNTSAMVGTP